MRFKQIIFESLTQYIDFFVCFHVSSLKIREKTYNLVHLSRKAIILLSFNHQK
jgi:hypothetical protein